MGAPSLDVVDLDVAKFTVSGAIVCPVVLVPLFDLVSDMDSLSVSN